LLVKNVCVEEKKSFFYWNGGEALDLRTR